MNRSLFFTTLTYILFSCQTQEPKKQTFDGFIEDLKNKSIVERQSLVDDYLSGVKNA